MEKGFGKVWWLKMMRKVPMRLLSFLLAGVMTVTSVQMPVYAAEVDVEQEAVTGEGIEEKESEAGTEAEEAGEAGEIPEVSEVSSELSEVSIEETEKADGLTELGSDSTPGDTVTEEAADPVISDAAVPEIVESEESVEPVVPKEDVAAEPVESVDAAGEMPELTEGTDAAGIGEEEELPVSGELFDTVDTDPTTPVTPTYTFTSPTNRTYFTGEEIIPTGAKITEVTGTTSKIIDVTSDMIEGFQNDKEGLKTLTIKYNNETIGSFDVLVIQKPTALKIAFGEELSTILPTNASPYGTWSWGANVPAKANRAGKQTYELKFTPDPVKYNPTTFKELTIAKQEVNVTCDLGDASTQDVEVRLDELSYDKYSTVYDGTKKEPKVSVLVGGVALTQNTDYKVVYGDNTNVNDGGTVTITGTGTAEAGCTGTRTVTFAIEPAKLRLTAVARTIYFKNKGDGTIYIIKNVDENAATQNEIVELYNGKNQPEFDYTVSGLANADFDSKTKKGQKGKIDISVDYKCDYNLTKQANYTVSLENVTITGSSSSNYTLDEDDIIEGTLRVSEFEAQPVKIKGVNSGSTKVYDEKIWSDGSKAEVVFGDISVSNIIAEASYSGKLRDGTPYPADKSSEPPKDAGDYTVTYELSQRPDHKDELYALEGASYTFSITPRVLTITAGSYHVAAGESVPTVDEDPNKNELIKLIKELGNKFYTVEGFLDKDKNNPDNQAKILNTDNLTLRYGEDGISANKKGSFDIIPYGAELCGEDENGNPTNIYTNNYEIKPVNGTLTVEGRKKFDYDFTSIEVEDMVYSSKPHNISGYASGMGTYKILITGEVRKEGYTNIDQGWDTEDDPDDSRNNNYKRKSVNVPAENIVEEYGKIAPIEVGDYTVRIYSEINDEKNVYEYDGQALVDRDFQILPMKEHHMKLVGVTGVTNKVYDGKVTDLSEAIKNAQVWTNEDIDVTEKVEPKVSIREVLPKEESGRPVSGAVLNGYGTQEFDRKNPDADKMPSDAGSYELVFDIAENSAQNFVAHEWSIPFVIKKRPLTVTVVDKKIPVDPNGDGSLPADLKYDYIITDDTITDEEKKVLKNEDFEEPLIEPAVEVDTRVTSSYDLVGSGKIGSSDKKDGYNYEINYVPGKLFVQTKLWGVKELDLTNNKNIPHGKTLQEIAEEYLPKTVVIYLNQDKTVEDKADITWDTEELVSGAYNINSKTAQNFKMRGTIALPDTVYIDKENEDDGWLTVTVDISVREANDGSQAKKPRADVASGTVGEGTKVSLSTDEEGAQIYYTIEADNPSLSVTSRRYTAPIEIKCTMIIRAVSRVYGKLDSEELYLYYYYNKNTKPDDPDDPDDPSGPQVPDDDIPKDEDGKPLDIPKGMWVTDVAQYTYSGTAVRPQVRVYDYRTRLEEDEDYTISYKNNVNAADKNTPRNAPTIVIKGKGNYEGKFEKNFTIAPKNINDVHEENGRTVYDVKMDDITVAFVADKAQKPVVAASWNGKKLVNKKDFTFEDTSYTAVGTYSVTVTGNGNYTGERKIPFTITNAVPASSLTVNKIADYNYTGQEIRPTVIVTYQKTVLQPGLEYTVSYEDNKEIGTASVVIKGNGRFAGVKRVNFKIKAPAALKKAEVELVFHPGADVYTGREIRPNQIKMAVQAENNGAVETRVLTESDYKVSYKNNVKAGTATAIFEGVGAYGGTLKKTFKIAPYNLQDIQQDQITVQASYPYMKGGSKQKPVVLFDGKALQEGIDYTLSYKNNKRVGDTAVMTIKGKGNFKGSVTRTYQVTMRDISDMTVAASDKVYKPKIKNYTTKVRVMDSNGKALKAGKDYDAHIAYSYEERIVSASGEVKEAGTPVAEFETIPIGTKLRVTVTAIGQNFQGTVTGTFRMVQADVAKAKVTVPVMTYTGKAIEPGQSEIAVTLNGIPLTAEDYKIVGYANNVNQGTAKLTIQGQGVYGGTKTVKFKIRKKSMIAQLFG